MGKKSRRQKTKRRPDDDDDGLPSLESSTDSDQKQEEQEQEEPEAMKSELELGQSLKKEEIDKYEIYKTKEYTRGYPENGGKFEYFVFIQCKDERPLGDCDMITLGSVIKRHSNGVKQLKRLNKYKIGVIFDKPSLANELLSNT